MGTDIHIFIEYKLGDGEWFADKNHKVTTEIDYKYVNSVVGSYRDYRLFGKLANVRMSKGSRLPKGVPKDVSDIVRKAVVYMGVDGHSHSYDDLQTFKQIFYSLEYSEIPLDPIPNAFNYVHDRTNSDKDLVGYHNIIKYCEDKVLEYKTDLEVEAQLLEQNINTNVECRLVYFFDN